LLANLTKGSENKELYLNTNYILGELAQNPVIYDYLVEESFIKDLLDLLNEDDTSRFVCVCKSVSTIIAQLKKNALNESSKE